MQVTVKAQGALLCDVPQTVGTGELVQLRVPVITFMTFRQVEHGEESDELHKVGKLIFGMDEDVVVSPPIRQTRKIVLLGGRPRDP
ncbi:hypothetical protein RUM43_008935 [Polyplax serrata]|uniref:Uncharacterized protein n=1 Tax=Polyplax serrata TaxID=468196 RepID=A0AAN8PA14_POLSC